MCGIAGILGSLDNQNRAALRRMTDAMGHRGPDATGFWESSEDERGFGCMLGHRRLSILDLSHAGDQPMSFAGQLGLSTIVFNGEIYNFKEFRRGLTTRGEAFRSSGDTAVMLRLLAQEGPDAVSRLRGMFAFALWNERERSLMLARDPLGIKPLYVCRNIDPTGNWSLVFSSELRSLLASGLIEPPRLDRGALASVVWNGFVVGPATAVEGVESLTPGEARVVDSGGRTTRQWDHGPSQVARARQVTEHELREVVVQSVRAHLVSDVPVGIFLSSGVDSGAVANLAQRVSSGSVHTFTLCFREPEFNEGVAARDIARAIGTEHHEIYLSEGEFQASLNDAIDALDQPTFDGLNSYFISKAVREAGVKVALVGTGGDELFGGYSSFRAIPAMLAWQARTKFVSVEAKRKIAAVLTRTLARRNGAKMPPQTRWAKLPAMVRAGSDLVALYQLAYALFLPEFYEELLSDGLAGDFPQGLNQEVSVRLEGRIAARTPLSAVSELEQRLFLGERLLRDTDAASMAVSLETRLPLVDVVVRDAVAQLSDHVRYRPLGKKTLLRAIGLDGLDPALFARPKRGFVLPFDQWIRQSLRRDMDQTLRDDRLATSVGLNGEAVRQLWDGFQNGAPGLYWSRVWALYILMRWCRRHGVFVG